MQKLTANIHSTDDNLICKLSSYSNICVVCFLNCPRPSTLQRIDISQINFLISLKIWNFKRVAIIQKTVIKRLYEFLEISLDFRKLFIKRVLFEN